MTEQCDMTAAPRDEALERLLVSYQNYYNIKTDGVEAPFAAEAEFHTHGERYFLMKSARLSSEDAHEYVYFAVVPRLTAELFGELDETAWERGTAKVEPKPDHKSSDVALLIIADEIEKDAVTALKKSKHYKSYKNRIWGWSQYRVIAFDLGTGKTVYNRLGKPLKKLVSNINGHKTAKAN